MEVNMSNNLSANVCNIEIKIENVPIDVMVKVLTERIFFHHKHYGIQYCNFVALMHGGEWRLVIVNPRDEFERDLELFLKDYGNTWALTKEELKYGIQSDK